jgi:NTE family protein
VITGLVLTGGGARAAYQVGALRALAEICPTRESPFQVFAGISAGAINSVALASRADDFTLSVDELERTWSELTPDRVYRTDVRSLVSITTRWMRDLSSAGVLGRSSVNHLLDTRPLRALLNERLPLPRLPSLYRSGCVRGVAVTVTNYLTGTAITFYDGAGDIEPWSRSTRIGKRQRLELDHVMASAAIPIFFPPVKIDDVFFGDGCVRMIAPMSPAIHLGADRIVAVGVRHPRSPGQTAAVNRVVHRHTLPLSEIAGVLLNAVFLDSLESDVERLERINRTLSFVAPEYHLHMPQPLRPIPTLVLRPSVDLGGLAADQYSRFPRTLRYLLRGIGATGEVGADLLSYLAFEPVYVGRLVELGYRDTLARRADVEAFFEGRHEAVATRSPASAAT